MKKIVACVLFVAMAVSLAGCVTLTRIPDHSATPVSTETIETQRTPGIPNPSPETGAVSSVAGNELPEATPEPEPEPTSGYETAAAFIMEMTEAMQTALTDDSNVNAKPPKVFVSFFLTHAKGLSEDTANMDEVLHTWKEKFRCKDAQLFHDSPHDYMLTGTWPNSDDKFDIHCRYAPETGALQMLCDQNGKLRESVEFKPLGNDSFALQYHDSGYEKAIITYKGGQILAFHYGEIWRPHAYRSIYPDGQGLDDKWLYEDSAADYGTELIYDGTKLTAY